MRTRNNTVIITGADLSPGHEYEVVVQAVSSQGLLQSPDDSPRNSIVIKGKETTPSQPSSLTATGGIAKIYLSWDVQTDKDFDVMEVWALATDNLALAVKIAETKTTTFTDNIGSTGQTRYYWLRARNTSGKTSLFYPETNGVNATTTGVEATDIEDFAIDATKLFTNTIILTADVWSNNTPVAGQITWNTHYLVYGGAYYRVTGSSTALRYVYWDVGHTAGSGTVADPYITTYGTTATYTAATDRFVIVVNESGVIQKVWNASANMVIGSAFIMDAAIVHAKIGLLAVTDENVSNLSATKITTGTLSAIPYQTAAGIIGAFLLPDTETGILVRHASYKVFECKIAGTDIGDVYIGNYDGGVGALWDQSAGTFRIKGILEIAATSSGISNLSDAGDLATKDTIAATDCDTTIIDGGKIITGLLTADNIQTGTLTGRVVQTAASGQRAIIDSADNTFKFYIGAGAGTKVVEINAGTYGYIIVGDQTGKELAYIKDGSIQLWSDTDSKQVITFMKDNGGWITAGWINSDGDASLTDVGVNSLSSTNNVVSTAGYVRAFGGFIDGTTGVGIDTTFLDADGNTITVSGGIITAKTAP